jgi:hypothetical protein
VCFHDDGRVFVATTGGATSTPGDASPPPGDDDGCGCSVPGSRPTTAPFLLFAAAVADGVRQTTSQATTELKELHDPSPNRHGRGMGAMPAIRWAPDSAVQGFGGRSGEASVGGCVPDGDTVLQRPPRSAARVAFWYPTLSLVWASHSRALGGQSRKLNQPLTFEGTAISDKEFPPCALFHLVCPFFRWRSFWWVAIQQWRPDGSKRIRSQGGKGLPDAGATSSGTGGV